MYITFKSEKLIILISFETFYIICCDYCSIDSSFNTVIQTSSNGVILSNDYCDYEAEMKQEKKKREKEKKRIVPLRRSELSLALIYGSDQWRVSLGTRRSIIIAVL